METKGARTGGFARPSWRTKGARRGGFARPSWGMKGARRGGFARPSWGMKGARRGLPKPLKPPSRTLRPHEGLAKPPFVHPSSSRRCDEAPLRPFNPSSPTSCRPPSLPLPSPFKPPFDGALKGGFRPVSNRRDLAISQNK